MLPLRIANFHHLRAKTAVVSLEPRGFKFSPRELRSVCLFATRACFFWTNGAFFLFFCASSLCIALHKFISLWFEVTSCWKSASHRSMICVLTSKGEEGEGGRTSWMQFSAPGFVYAIFGHVRQRRVLISFPHPLFLFCLSFSIALWASRLIILTCSLRTWLPQTRGRNLSPLCGCPIRGTFPPLFVPLCWCTSVVELLYMDPGSQHSQGELLTWTVLCRRLLLSWSKLRNFQQTLAQVLFYFSQYEKNGNRSTVISGL